MENPFDFNLSDLNDDEDEYDDDTPEMKPLTLAEKVETGAFTDDDADERGWIVYRDPPDEKGVRNERRVPVQHWSRYERHHNL